MLSSDEQEKYAEIDKKLDLTKALLPQLATLTKEEYIMLMNRPSYLETTDSLQIYEDHDYDQRMKSNINHNQIVFPLVSLVMFAIAMHYKASEKTTLFEDLVYCSWYFVLGALYFFFVEYYQHRWVLHNEHDKIPEKITPENIMDFFNSHHVHHMFANQEYIIAVSLPIISKHASFYIFLETLVFGIVRTMAVNSGFFLAFIFYDSMHFWFHFGGDFKIKFFQDLKEKHMKHHYRDRRKDFGVTSSFWDYVFDTV